MGSGGLWDRGAGSRVAWVVDSGGGAEAWAAPVAWVAGGLDSLFYSTPQTPLKAMHSQPE